jgi:tungstate transport system substrate-binding protein
MVQSSHDYKVPESRNSRQRSIPSSRKVLFSLISLLFAVSALVGAQTSTVPQRTGPFARIKMATTTSTEQSGLLRYMLPVFEKETGYKVDVVAVGTGASLKIGQNGDCDIVLVHARSLEDAFMTAGYGSERRDVMYNDFILVGPASDPANIHSATSAIDAFTRIDNAKATFVSRGDNSGTDVKEKELWKEAGIAPKGSWYKEAGQGMSQCITMADQMNGYTLSDRATFLAVRKTVNLSILYQGDKPLLNPYGIITVNPKRWSGLNVEGAKALMDFFTGPEGRSLITSFNIEGAQVFFLFK